MYILARSTKGIKNIVVTHYHDTHRPELVEIIGTLNLLRRHQQLRRA